MIGKDRLRRSYQRLLRVYPRWYRREWGLEMMTTMLDDAAPGQRRPAFGDVLDVLRAGVRMRLRPPYGVGGVFVVAVVSLYLALVGAAAALALVGYPGPPSEAQAIAAATSAVGIQPQNLAGPPVRCGAFCDFTHDPADQVVAYDSAIFDHSDFTRVGYGIPWDDATGVVARSRQRLIDAGWSVGPTKTWSPGVVEFDAAGAEVWIMVRANVKDPDALYEVAAVEVDVQKGFSSSALIAAFGGFVGGFLSSWPVVVWVLQRHRRHSRTRRHVIVAVAAPVFVVASLTLWAVAVLAIVGSSGHAGDVRDPLTAVLLAPQAAAPGLGAPVFVGVGLLMLSALALAGGPSRGGGAPTRTWQHDIRATG